MGGSIIGPPFLLSSPGSDCRESAAATWKKRDNGDILWTTSAFMRRSIPGTPTSPGHVACPYRGLLRDPETRLIYPSEATHCFKATPPGPVSQTHQASYCLTPQHRMCPVYQALQPTALPDEVLGVAPAAGRWRWLWLLAALALVVLVGGVFVGWLMWRPAEREPAAVLPPSISVVAGTSSTQLPSLTPLPVTPSATPVPTHNPSPTASMPALPTATPSPLPASPPEPSATLPAPATQAPQVRAMGPPVNIRTGPDVIYPIVGGLAGDLRLDIIGISPFDSWWQVCCVNGAPGWVFSPFVEVIGDVQAVPEVPHPPTPSAP